MNTTPEMWSWDLRKFEWELAPLPGSVTAAFSVDGVTWAPLQLVEGKWRGTVVGEDHADPPPNALVLPVGSHDFLLRAVGDPETQTAEGGSVRVRSLAGETPMVRPSDLAGQPGAPFTLEQIASAVDAVRNEAGWHIAPQRTETIEVETGCSTIAVLPSLHVVSVNAVRNLKTGVELSNWRVVRPRGVLVNHGGWPEAIEVDLVHGYDTCPPSLYPVIAERAQRAKAGMVRQESILGRSVSYASEYDPASLNAIAHFTLPPEAS